MKHRVKTSRMVKYIFLAVVAFIGLIPFVLIVFTSIKTTVDALSMPPKWFFTPTGENYRVLMTDINFLKSIKNSLFIAAGATLLATIVGITASYTLSRFRFRGKKGIAYFILALRIVPPIVFVIPYFLIWRSLR
ncbi:MAG: carbohydrate ABC transporter permease, partial [Atribacterota bacterium]